MPRGGRGKSSRGGRGGRVGRGTGGRSANRHPRPVDSFGGKSRPRPDALSATGSAQFLCPAKRALVKVPLEFISVKEWAACVANNLLAEYYYVYADAKRGGGSRLGTAEVTGPSEVVLLDRDAGAEPLLQHLLLINGTAHIVVRQTIRDGKARIELKPELHQRGRLSVVSLGYIGSYLAEHAALVELAASGSTGNVLQGLLKPSVGIPGDFVRAPLSPHIPCNESQRTAVEALQYSVEKIQGPPGTGKSTTIYHILTSRIAPAVRKLVCCSRNVAVESIAQKLEHCTADKLVVFGAADRIGQTASRHTLSSKCERSPRVERAVRAAATARRCGMLLRTELDRYQAGVQRSGGRFWTLAWAAFIRRKHMRAALLCAWCERVSAAGASAAAAIAAGPAHKQAMVEAEIYLCTIASTSRMIREWEESSPGEPLKMHTIIVDECGCTPESSIALLLRLTPQNLILVGDHKQLPPTSMLPPQDLQGTGHARSVLERSILASGRFHRLLEQYRMPSRLCNVVSKTFYHGVLSTPASVSRSKAADAVLEWVSIDGREEVAPGQTSTINNAEAEVASTVALGLRFKHPAASVAVLCFYKGQREAIMRLTPALAQVDVLTVDACQGAEFDYVVLSPKSTLCADSSWATIAGGCDIAKLSYYRENQTAWTRENTQAGEIEVSMYDAAAAARKEARVAWLVEEEEASSLGASSRYGLQKKKKTFSEEKRRQTGSRAQNAEGVRTITSSTHRSLRTTKPPQPAQGEEARMYVHTDAAFPWLPGHQDSDMSIDRKRGADIGGKGGGLDTFVEGEGCGKETEDEMILRAIELSNKESAAAASAMAAEEELVRLAIIASTSPISSEVPSPNGVGGEGALNPKKLYEIFGDQQSVDETLSRFNGDCNRALVVLLETSGDHNEGACSDFFDYAGYDYDISESGTRDDAYTCSGDDEEVEIVQRDAVSAADIESLEAVRVVGNARVIKPASIYDEYREEHDEVDDLNSRGDWDHPAEASWSSPKVSLKPMRPSGSCDSANTEIDARSPFVVESREISETTTSVNSGTAWVEDTEVPFWEAEDETKGEAHRVEASGPSVGMSAAGLPRSTLSYVSGRGRGRGRGRGKSTLPPIAPNTAKGRGSPASEDADSNTGATGNDLADEGDYRAGYSNTNNDGRSVMVKTGEDSLVAEEGWLGPTPQMKKTMTALWSTSTDLPKWTDSQMFTSKQFSLVGLGFNETQAAMALAACDNDIRLASEWLFKGNGAEYGDPLISDDDYEEEEHLEHAGALWTAATSHPNRRPPRASGKIQHDEVSDAVARMFAMLDMAEPELQGYVVSAVELAGESGTKTVEDDELLPLADMIKEHGDVDIKLAMSLLRACVDSHPR